MGRKPPGSCCLVGGPTGGGAPSPLPRPLALTGSSPAGSCEAVPSLLAGASAGLLSAELHLVLGHARCMDSTCCSLGTNTVDRTGSLASRQR